MHDNSNQEAIPLMAPDEYVHDFHSGVAHVSARSFKDQDPVPLAARSSRSTFLLFLACVVTILSLSFNATTLIRTGRPLQSPQVLDSSNLRRPSLYLGLERVPEIKMQMGDIHTHVPVPSTGPPNRSQLGWPSQVARVNSDYPYYAFAQDGWVVLTEQVRSYLSLRLRALYL